MASPSFAVDGRVAVPKTTPANDLLNAVESDRFNAVKWINHSSAAIEKDIFHRKETTTAAATTNYNQKNAIQTAAGGPSSNGSAADILSEIRRGVAAASSLSLTSMATTKKRIVESLEVEHEELNDGTSKHHLDYVRDALDRTLSHVETRWRRAIPRTSDNASASETNIHPRSSECPSHVATSRLLSLKQQLSNVHQFLNDVYSWDNRISALERIVTEVQESFDAVDTSASTTHHNHLSAEDHGVALLNSLYEVTHVGKSRTLQNGQDDSVMTFSMISEAVLRCVDLQNTARLLAKSEEYKPRLAHVERFVFQLRRQIAEKFHALTQSYIESALLSTSQSTFCSTVECPILLVELTVLYVALESVFDSSTDPFIHHDTNNTTVTKSGSSQLGQYSLSPILSPIIDALDPTVSSHISPESLWSTYMSELVDESIKGKCTPLIDDALEMHASSEDLTLTALGAVTARVNSVFSWHFGALEFVAKGINAFADETVRERFKWQLRSTMASLRVWHSKLIVTLWKSHARRFHKDVITATEARDDIKPLIEVLVTFETDLLALDDDVEPFILGTAPSQRDLSHPAALTDPDRFSSAFPLTCDVIAEGLGSLITGPTSSTTPDTSHKTSGPTLVSSYLSFAAHPIGLFSIDRMSIVESIINAIFRCAPLPEEFIFYPKSRETKEFKLADYLEELKTYLNDQYPSALAAHAENLLSVALPVYHASRLLSALTYRPLLDCLDVRWKEALNLAVEEDLNHLQLSLEDVEATRIRRLLTVFRDVDGNKTTQLNLDHDEENISDRTDVVVAFQFLITHGDEMIQAERWADAMMDKIQIEISKTLFEVFSDPAIQPITIAIAKGFMTGSRALSSQFITVESSTALGNTTMIAGPHQRHLLKPTTIKASLIADQFSKMSSSLAFSSTVDSTPPQDDRVPMTAEATSHSCLVPKSGSLASIICSAMVSLSTMLFPYIGMAFPDLPEWTAPGAVSQKPSHTKVTNAMIEAIMAIFSGWMSAKLASVDVNASIKPYAAQSMINQIEQTMVEAILKIPTLTPQGVSQLHADCTTLCKVIMGFCSQIGANRADTECTEMSQSSIELGNNEGVTASPKFKLQSPLYYLNAISNALAVILGIERPPGLQHQQEDKLFDPKDFDRRIQSWLASALGSERHSETTGSLPSSRDEVAGSAKRVVGRLPGFMSSFRGTDRAK